MDFQPKKFGRGGVPCGAAGDLPGETGGLELASSRNRLGSDELANISACDYSSLATKAAKSVQSLGGYKTAFPGTLTYRYHSPKPPFEPWLGAIEVCGTPARGPERTPAS